MVLSKQVALFAVFFLLFASSQARATYQLIQSSTTSTPATVSSLKVGFNSNEIISHLLTLCVSMQSTVTDVAVSGGINTWSSAQGIVSAASGSRCHCFYVSNAVGGSDTNITATSTAGTGTMVMSLAEFGGNETTNTGDGTNAQTGSSPGGTATTGSVTSTVVNDLGVACGTTSGSAISAAGGATSITSLGGTANMVNSYITFASIGAASMSFTVGAGGWGAQIIMFRPTQPNKVGLLPMMGVD